MRYKVGDKVIVVANGSGHGFDIGTIGDVIGVYFSRITVMDENEEHWYLGEEDVEPC